MTTTAINATVFTEKKPHIVATRLILNRALGGENYYVNPDGTISSYDAAEEQQESNQEYLS